MEAADDVMAEPKPVLRSREPSVWYVTDPLPTTMGADELRRVLNLAPSTFFAYQRAGKFKRFEFRRPVTHAKRYSGALVKRYLENENL